MMGSNDGGFVRRLSEKLAEPGVVVMTPAQAAAAGVATIQGSPTAVAPIGETDFDLLTPIIPGGAQFDKVVVVVNAQPIRDE